MPAGIDMTGKIRSRFSADRSLWVSAFRDDSLADGSMMIVGESTNYAGDVICRVKTEITGLTGASHLSPGEDSKVSDLETFFQGMFIMSQACATEVRLCPRLHDELFGRKHTGCCSQ